ncbi:fimbrial protein [Citrobacter koseri]|uniref:fimbrial protein n=1 Tax=Citrobacter koseri TaxID=545 RepID=UPI0024B6CA40|nr:fimbrial protein [Citrobacter koseri]MDI9800331.1 fimbrial protein [Citrobacter koseri]
MSLIRIARWGIVLCSLWTGISWAACWQTHSAYEINMAMGRVVVNPDLPVGSVIATKTWTMPDDNTVYVTCDRIQNLTFDAKVVASGLVMGANKIFSTTIPGIGLRFSRAGAVSMTYPDSYTTRGSSFRLAGSTFTLDIIKTSEITGSGTLASGPYTEYGPGFVILKASLNADAITIVSPSCTVLSGKNMNVDIGTIKRSDLNGVGTTAGGKDFNIQLQCSGGVSESGFANIHTTFSGNLATSTTAAQGVLINEKSGNAAAKGIGVQVLKDGTPLEFSKKYNIGTLQTQETRYITLPYRARFYQYASTTSTGEVESHMIFNLTYD